MVNHPWLLDTHAEELAELEFRHGDGDKLRRAILDAASGHALTALRSCGLQLPRVNWARCLRESRGAVTHHVGLAGARRGRRRRTFTLWWTHVVSLHRKSRTLHKELKDAEMALGNEPSEENLAWLRDIQARLAALEGAEALIEGFGALSGAGPDVLSMTRTGMRRTAGEKTETAT